MGRKLHPGDAETMSEEYLAKFLTHQRPEIRCFGRLLATGVGATFQKWINAEYEKNPDFTTWILTCDAGTQFMGQTAAALIVNQYLRVDKKRKEALIKNVVENFELFLRLTLDERQQRHEAEI